MKTISKKQIENLSDPIINTWVDNYQNNKDKNAFDNENAKPLIFLYNNFFYSHKPVVLIAAGPSLDENIKYLKDYQNNALIICVDMALYAVQQAGITPDFVISVDSSQYISDMWKICETRDLKLICPTTTHPYTINFWEGQIFFYNQIDRNTDAKGIVLSHLIQPTSHYGNLPNRGFVGATALQIAHMFNPNVVILAGYDFAFRDEKLYCNGVFESRFAFLEGTEAYHTAKAERLKKVLDEAFTVDGVLTSDILGNCYLPIFTNLVQFLRLNVINSTEGGLFKLNNMSLNESLQQYCKDPIKKYDTFKNKKRKRR